MEAEEQEEAAGGLGAKPQSPVTEVTRMVREMGTGSSASVQRAEAPSQELRRPHWPSPAELERGEQPQEIAALPAPSTSTGAIPKARQLRWVSCGPLPPQEEEEAAERRRRRREREAGERPQPAQRATPRAALLHPKILPVGRDSPVGPMDWEEDPRPVAPQSPENWDLPSPPRRREPPAAAGVEAVAVIEERALPPPTAPPSGWPRLRLDDGYKAKKYNPRRQITLDDYEPYSLPPRPPPSPGPGQPIRREGAAAAAAARVPSRAAPWRGCKLEGVMFGGLRAIPTDPAVDPPPRTCYNCWEGGHNKTRCPVPPRHIYCNNCGRRGVDLSDCPRCAEAHREYLRRRGVEAPTRRTAPPPGVRDPRPADGRATVPQRPAKRGREAAEERRPISDVQRPRTAPREGAPVAVLEEICPQPEGRSPWARLGPAVTPAPRRSAEASAAPPLMELRIVPAAPPPPPPPAPVNPARQREELIRVLHHSSNLSPEMQEWCLRVAYGDGGPPPPHHGNKERGEAPPPATPGP